MFNKSDKTCVIYSGLLQTILFVKGRAHAGRKLMRLFYLNIYNNLLNTNDHILYHRILFYRYIL